MKGKLNQILATIGVLLACLCLGSQAVAVEFDESKYEVYFGDFNSDGNAGDIYFHPKDKFVLIHGDIAIPLFISGGDGFAYYANGSGSAELLTLSDSELSGYTMAVFGVEYFFSDDNADGYLDLIVTSPPQGMGRVVAMGSSSSSGTPELFVSIPDTFNYDLSEDFFLPDLSDGDFVAITEGAYSVSNGVASYNVPIKLPPAINNLKPSLSLTYSSDNNGSGAVGLGWSISGLSAITLCHQTISQNGELKYGKYGSRLCLDGEMLEVISTDIPEGGFGQEGPPEGYYSYWAEGASYRKELNGADRIDSKDDEGVMYFEVRKKNGLILSYGRQSGNENSRVYKLGSSQNSYADIQVWALDTVEDRYGNKYTIHYDVNENTGEHNVSHINLSPDASVVFNYEERSGSDIPWGYSVGNKFQFSKLLKSVTTYVGVTNSLLPEVGTAVKHYSIEHELSPATERYLVSRISECGFDEGQMQCAAPLDFDWQAGEMGFGDSFSLEDCDTGDLLGASQVIDLNSDGYNDLLAGHAVALGTPEGCFTKPGWLQVPTSLEDQWASMQALRTQNGYALISAGDDGKLLQIRMLDFDNETTTTETREANAQGSMLIVRDMTGDGLDDFIYGTRYYRQQRTNAVEFTDYYTGLLDLAADWNEKHEPALIDIDENSFPELFFTIPDIEEDPAYGEPPENKMHFYHSESQYGEIFSKDTPNGQVEDNSILVSDLPGAPQMCSTNVVAAQYRAFADLNGDGNQDIVYHTDSQWKVRILKEDGTLGVEMDVGESSGGTDTQYIVPYDYNKDGITDIIDSCRGLVMLAGHNGDPDAIGDASFAFRSLPSGYTGPSDISCPPEYSGTSASAYQSDVNNDGLLDLLQNGNARLAKQAQPDLLQVVTNGFGKQIEFSYSPLTGDDNNGKPFYTPGTNVNFPEVHVHRGRQTVKSIAISDGLGGYDHQYFNYTGGKTDLHGRGFLGFSKIEVTDTKTETLTTVKFRQSFPYIGNKKEFIQEDLNGNKISAEWTYYTSRPSALGSSFFYPVQTYTEKYDLTDGAFNQAISASMKTVSLDNYGNITSEIIDVGEPSVSKHSVNNRAFRNKQTHSYTEYRDQESWLVSFRDSTTSATTVDGETVTVTTEYEPEPDTLDVKVQYNYVGEEVNNTVTTTRNAKGIVTNVKADASDSVAVSGVAVARNTKFSDFENDIYPTTLINAKSHITKLTYDKRFGSTLTTTNITNTTNPEDLEGFENFEDIEGSITSTNHIDSLGRTIGTTSENGNESKVISFYCSNAPSLLSCPVGGVYLIATEVTNPNAIGYLGAPISVSYYDMLRREIRREVFNFNQDIVRVDTRYDNKGRLAQVSEPFTGTEADAWTTYSNYDVLGRVGQITSPDNGGVSYAYDEFEANELTTTEIISVVKPTGSIETQTKTSVKNLLGQVVRVKDNADIQIDYTYDVLGNLKSTVVDENEDTRISITHDVAGNKTYISDPDAGDIGFEYNGFGELRRQTWQPDTSDAKSITYAYDVLGRKTDRLDQKGQQATSYEWVWDTVKPGLLSSQEGNGYTQTYTYNSYAQLQSSTTAISGAGGSRNFSYTYDVFGRPETVTYPSELRIKHEYHAAGALVKTLDDRSGRQLFMLGNVSDTRGNLTHQMLGNGVATSRAYDAVNGQLQKIVSGYVQGDGFTVNGRVQNLTYTFDSLGNLYSRQTQRKAANGSALENILETFTYDEVNRLEENTLWRSGIEYGVKSFLYDNLGNLQQKGEINDFQYQQINGAGVHAVTQAAGQIYSYDAYGNIKERSDGSGSSELMEYDVFNKPTQIGNTSFSYGPSHARFKQTNGSTTKYYFGGGYEEEIENGVTTKKSYVGNYLVQSVKQSEVSNVWLHQDHLGSLEAITNDAGEFVKRMSFDAWGMSRNADWSEGSSYDINGVVDSGFGGHEMLEDLNLIHMNGRVYDPVTGRFLSADLFVQAPYNSQSFNRYTYVINNPLSFVDPSGYRFSSCMPDQWLGNNPDMDPWGFMDQFGRGRSGSFLGWAGNYAVGDFGQLTDVNSISSVFAQQSMAISTLAARFAFFEEMRGSSSVTMDEWEVDKSGNRISPSQESGSTSSSTFSPSLALPSSVQGQLNGMKYRTPANPGGQQGRSFWGNPGRHLPPAPQWFMDGVTGFGDGVYWGITLGHGFGQGEGLNWMRENYLSSGGVDTESGVYVVGFGVGAIEGSFALSGASAVKYAGFRYDSFGRWKNNGVWQEGGHFHLGTGGGLQKHHLPQQFGNWWNNLKGLVKRKWGS